MDGLSHPLPSAAHHEPRLPAVPLLDMQRQYEPLRDAIRTAIERVCESGRFVMGPDCEQLEQAVAAYCGATHAVACASGSDALLLALMALGIEPGDEVLVPSFTFFATASAVSRLGAIPVFIDIEPTTFNIDPERIAGLVTPATKAIIPVHLFGQCADMAAICQAAASHRLAVVEDAAQAIGAGFGNRSAGTMGEMGCFSFYPTKNLGGFGDGGLLTTNDADLAAKLRLLRAHGMEPRYYHKVIGVNSRLDTIQAAVLNVKLPHLNRWAQLRRANADFYAQLMTECGLDRTLRLPTTAPNRRHVWNQYVIRVPDGRRDAPAAPFGRRANRNRNLLSRPLAPAGVLRIAGRSDGEFARIGASRCRGARAADFPGIASRRATGGRRSHRRILRTGAAVGGDEAAEVSRSSGGQPGRPGVESGERRAESREQGRRAGQCRGRWGADQSSDNEISFVRFDDRQTISSPSTIPNTTSA